LRKLKVGGLILGDQGAVAVVQCFVALLLFSFEGRSLLRIARICKRLRSLGIDSASLRSLAGLYNIWDYRIGPPGYIDWPNSGSGVIFGIGSFLMSLQSGCQQINWT